MLESNKITRMGGGGGGGQWLHYNSGMPDEEKLRRLLSTKRVHQVSSDTTISQSHFLSVQNEKMSSKVWFEH